MCKYTYKQPHLRGDKGKMNDIDRDEKGRFAKGRKKTGGREKGKVYINDRLQKMLREKDPKTQMRYIDTLAEKILAQALADNDRVLIELWRMVDGMPKQKVDFGCKDGVNINIRFMDAEGLRDEKKTR